LAKAKDRKNRVERPRRAPHLATMSKHETFEDPEAGPEYRRIARAIAFLVENYAEQPSLDEAAAVAALSPHHFQRVFTRYVGVSPKNFVGCLTLERAKEDLRRGSTVLDAAFKAGLSGPSRLHDLCLKVEAMTPGEYAKRGMGLEIIYGFYPCPFGIALILETDRGICGVAFCDKGGEEDTILDMSRRWPLARYLRNDLRAQDHVRRIFTPKDGPKDDNEIGLHLLGTPWQIKVWQALLKIPSGKVATYGGVAASLKAEKASRAVGTAVGRNPISYLIPCHRVLGSDGALTGYHWGTQRKRAMLAVEAARTYDLVQSPSTSAMV
jgi:AraC family transcriptional regulator, regulatory protein of adaptative response / methylated-DNA-[protein]-cysteine methyltransferase